MDYKTGKLISIVKQWLGNGTDKFEINGADLARAVFLYRTRITPFEPIPKGNYRIIDESNNKYLKVDEQIKNKAYEYQIIYDDTLKGSTYDEDFPELSVLVNKYNTLVKDTKIIEQYLKTNGIKADTKNMTQVLTPLEPNSFWATNNEGILEGLPIGDRNTKYELMLRGLRTDTENLISTNLNNSLQSIRDLRATEEEKIKKYKEDAIANFDRKSQETENYINNVKSRTENNINNIKSTAEVQITQKRIDTIKELQNYKEDTINRFDEKKRETTNYINNLKTNTVDYINDLKLGTERQLDEKSSDAILSVQKQQETSIVSIENLTSSSKIGITNLSNEFKEDIKQLANTSKEDIKKLTTNSKAELTQLATTSKESIAQLADTAKEKMNIAKVEILNKSKQEMDITKQEVIDNAKAEFTQLATTSKNDITELANTSKEEFTQLANTSKSDITELAKNSKEELTQLATTSKNDINEIFDNTERVANEVTSRKLKELDGEIFKRFARYNNTLDSMTEQWTTRFEENKQNLSEYVNEYLEQNKEKVRGQGITNIKQIEDTRFEFTYGDNKTVDVNLPSPVINISGLKIQELELLQNTKNQSFTIRDNANGYVICNLPENWKLCFMAIRNGFKGAETIMLSNFVDTVSSDFIPIKNNEGIIFAQRCSNEKFADNGNNQGHHFKKDELIFFRRYNNAFHSTMILNIWVIC